MQTKSVGKIKWGPDELQRAIDAAGVALWSWHVDTNEFAMDDTGYEMWHLEKGISLSFSQLSERIHPADKDRVWAAFNSTRAVVGPYEIDFRTLVNGDVRWISARGRGNDEGIRGRRMMGIFLDVTGRKQAQESSELLAGEMGHRVQNLLAIATGLTQITSRSSKSVEDMAVQLTRRLTALGRAHALVRPTSSGSSEAALLGDLLTVLLAPYDDKGAFSGRIRVAVPRVAVGERAAAGLALVVHELATNALKYGALSAQFGLLDVSGYHTGDLVRIVWTEQGGPALQANAKKRGYGTQLILQTIGGQFGGTVDYDWDKQGLIVTIVVKVGTLSD